MANTAVDIAGRNLEHAKKDTPSNRLTFGNNTWLELLETRKLSLFRHTLIRCLLVESAVVFFNLGWVFGIVVGLLFAVRFFILRQKAKFDELHYTSSLEWLSFFLLQAFPDEAPSSYNLLAGAGAICPKTGKMFALEITADNSLIYVYASTDADEEPERIVEVEEFRSYHVAKYQELTKVSS